MLIYITFNLFLLYLYKIIKTMIQLLNKEFKECEVLILPTGLILPSTNIYLDNKTDKLNYGFVKDKYDFNQQLFILDDSPITDGDNVVLLEKESTIGLFGSVVVYDSETMIHAIEDIRKVLGSVTHYRNVPHISEDTILDIINNNKKTVLVQYGDEDGDTSDITDLSSYELTTTADIKVTMAEVDLLELFKDFNNKFSNSEWSKEKEKWFYKNILNENNM